jgi:hypothetical protein
MSMDIYSRPGIKVVFAHLDAGYRYDIEKAEKHLVLGNTYTVDYTVVGSFRTDVYLMEIPGVYFNSVQFDNA